MSQNHTPSADALSALSELCKGASKPSTTLDKKIRRLVTGKPIGRWEYVPAYTSKLDEAYRLLPIEFAGMINVRDSRPALDMCAFALDRMAINVRCAAISKAKASSS
jgi:hypothetical protein